MQEYYFERECRTPHSESYNITRNDDQIGHVDIHYTPSVVQATLCVEESVATDDIQQLIETIDEQLIISSNVYREDFIVTVFHGHEIGIFSDEEDMDEEGLDEEGKN
ncbi:MAG: hypothetical protein NTV30_08100 [Chloroflexi bacterium]|nr:hypothetical protein [Chloroflexota bacterium]